MYIIMFIFFWYSDEATLNPLAREKGFAVQDVPRDGDCLFSAVAVQLENVGIHSRSVHRGGSRGFERTPFLAEYLWCYCI